MDTLDQNGVRPSQPTGAATLPAVASLAQRRLWLITKLTPGVPLYNSAHGIRLRGVLDPARLQRAILAVAARHQTLRMHFVDTGDESSAEPCVRVMPVAAAELPLVDLSHLAPPQRQEQAQRRAVDFARQPFDLATAPLFRTCLLRLGAEEHLLVFVVHHSIFDRWSVGILLRELAVFYAAPPGPAALPPITLTYTDFAKWQIEQQSDPAALAHLQYWRDVLSGAPPFLDLPADYPRPQNLRFDGATHATAISPELTANIRRVGQACGATPFMTFLTAFLVLLQRLSQQADLVIGTPVAGRNRLETEPLIGTFVNILPLRAQLQSTQSFRANLTALRSAILELLTHQRTSFDRIVETVRRSRDQSRHPLFDVVFNFHNVPPVAPWPGDVTAEVESIYVGVARYDLTLTLRPMPGGGMSCEVEYSRELFEPATIERWTRQYLVLLEGIITNPACPIARLPLLDAAARTLILENWNDTKADYPPDQCLHELIETQVRRTPDAVAAVFAGRQLTYAELNARANRLAHYLRGLGVKPDGRVAMCVERGIEMVVGLLAVLKAGGAYVPVDPAYPPERLRDMVEDSAPTVLLTQSRLKGLFAGLNPAPKVVDLAADDTDWANQSESNLECASVGLTAKHLAYMIYTSGSTGKPKGVMVEHRGVVNLLGAMLGTVKIDSTDCVLALTTITFDIAGLELYLPLICGARMALVDRQTTKDPVLLAKAIAKLQPTLLQATPATWQMLVEAGWQGGESLQALCGGEALTTALAARLRARVGHLWNVYGPTETTIWSTAEAIAASLAPHLHVPIGRPIANTRIYLLDAQAEPVPVGVAGELYIGGDGVARGYLNRLELTAERFVRDPFVPEAGARMYQTGDLAKWLPNGTLAFLGRNDFQVKLRGHQIELGEIEARLREHPAVLEAVVIARADRRGDKRLVAYYTGPETSAPGQKAARTEALKRHLAQRLPEYMLPAAYVWQPTLPLTPNGKLDRNALPVPELEHPAAPGQSVGPRNPEEALMADMWAKALKLNSVGVHDDFFDLGGHSLLAIRLCDEIGRQFGMPVPFNEFLGAPSVAALTKAVMDRRFATISQPAIALRAEGSKPPLFLVSGLGVDVISFMPLVRLLDADRPAYGLQRRGLDGKSPPHCRIEEMAADFLESVRRLAPHGPYYLAGFSSGSLIAYEMAQQLHRAGQAVAMLAILDRSAPGYLAPRAPAITRIGLHLRVLRTLHGRAAWAYLLARLRGIGRRLLRLEGRAPPNLLTPDRAVFTAEQQALDHYVPQPYAGSITIFKSQLDEPQRPITHERRTTNYDDPYLGWGRWIRGKIDFVHIFSGDHLQMIRPPGVKMVAAHLHELLSPTPDADETATPAKSPTAQ